LELIGRTEQSPLFDGSERLDRPASDGEVQNNGRDLVAAVIYERVERPGVARARRALAGRLPPLMTIVITCDAPQSHVDSRGDRHQLFCHPLFPTIAPSSVASPAPKFTPSTIVALMTRTLTSFLVIFQSIDSRIIMIICDLVTEIKLWVRLQ
jgi:hypothetical protein